MMREETHAVFIVRGGIGILTRAPGRQPKEMSPATKRDLNLERDARELERLLAIRRNRFPTPPVSLKLVALATGQHFGVSLDAIKGTTKYQTPLVARRVTYYLCRRLTSASYPQIGQYFGKDHTCPLRAVERIERRLAAGENKLADSINLICEVIGE